jgi:hypothetical protein
MYKNISKYSNTCPTQLAINSTNTLVVTNPIMSPLFTAQLITVASYNKLSAQAQADISVVAYSAKAHAQAFANTCHTTYNYNTQYIYYAVFNVTQNLTYSLA